MATRHLYCLGFLFTLLAFRVTPALAQPVIGAPALVKNINLTPNPDYSSSPYDFVAIGGVVCFTADDGKKGRELWKSDGTAAGTVQVKDISPGSVGLLDPSWLTNVNGTLYFMADDGSGWHLWRSNGTAAGTVRVKDSNSSLRGSFPQELTNVNGTLYFTADDGSRGVELWQSDGTAVGTMRVEDIWPDPESSEPLEFTVAGSRLFFSADDGRRGRELWAAPLSIGTLTLRDAGAANCVQLSLATGAYTFTTGSGRQISGQAMVEQRPTELKIRGGINRPYLVEGTIDLGQRSGMVTLRVRHSRGGDAKPGDLPTFRSKH